MESGASVDRLDTDLLMPDAQVVPLGAFRSLDFATDEHLDRYLICRKILLEGGADPTIPSLVNRHGDIEYASMISQSMSDINYLSDRMVGYSNLLYH